MRTNENVKKIDEERLEQGEYEKRVCKSPVRKTNDLGPVKKAPSPVNTNNAKITDISTLRKLMQNSKDRRTISDY